MQNCLCGGVGLVYVWAETFVHLGIRVWASVSGIEGDMGLMETVCWSQLTGNRPPGGEGLSAVFLARACQLKQPGVQKSQMIT